MGAERKFKHGVPARCYCGAPWQDHYRAGFLVAVTCTRGHDPSESLLRIPADKPLSVNDDQKG